MHLRHLHLPNPIPYNTSLSLQSALLNTHFAARSAQKLASSASASSTPSISTSSNPILSNPLRDVFPTLLTFQTTPTYTVGRRHLTSNPLSQSQIEFLTDHGRAEFHTAPRGGLLTYHAPGQCTGYLIADLRRHGLTPRCYIRMLEDAVIRTCADFGVKTCTTEDPGVWIEDDGKATTKKICAIGVQVSRGVATHGVGLNVSDKLGELSWGFQRIVACGLEGKSVTWLNGEGVQDVTVEGVGEVFAKEVARGLKVGEVRKVSREEVEEESRNGQIDGV